VVNRQDKPVSVTFQRLLSRRYRHLNTPLPPVLKEKELVLVSSSSSSLKRYKRKLHSSDEDDNA